MKKISRRSFITAMAAVSAAGVLAACGSSSSSTASSVASSAISSEATSSAASIDETGTHSYKLSLVLDFQPEISYTKKR